MIYPYNRVEIGSGDGATGINFSENLFSTEIYIGWEQTGDVNNPQWHEEYTIQNWRQCWSDIFQFMIKFEIWMFSSMDCTA